MTANCIIYHFERLKAEEAAMKAIETGAWIEIEPWPEDEFVITVKDENSELRRFCDELVYL